MAGYKDSKVKALVESSGRNRKEFIEGFAMAFLSDLKENSTIDDRRAYCAALYNDVIGAGKFDFSTEKGEGNPNWEMLATKILGDEGKLYIKEQLNKKNAVEVSEEEMPAAKVVGRKPPPIPTKKTTAEEKPVSLYDSHTRTDPSQIKTPLERTANAFNMACESLGTALEEMKKASSEAETAKPMQRKQSLSLGSILGKSKDKKEPVVDKVATLKTAIFDAASEAMRQIKNLETHGYKVSEDKKDIYGVKSQLNKIKAALSGSSEEQVKMFGDKFKGVIDEIAKVGGVAMFTDGVMKELESAIKKRPDSKS